MDLQSLFQFFTDPTYSAPLVMGLTFGLASFFSTMKNPVITVVNADGTGLKTLYTAPAGGGRLLSLIVSSTDTATRDLVLYLSIGGTDYPLATKTIAITAGTVAGTLSVNMLDPALIPGLKVDSNGNAYLDVASGGVIKVGVLVAVTAAKTLYVVGQVKE